MSVGVLGLTLEDLVTDDNDACSLDTGALTLSETGHGGHGHTVI